MPDVQTAYGEFLCSPEGVALFNQFKQVLYGAEDRLIDNILPTVRQALAHTEDARILDIGGADGQRISALSRRLEISPSHTIVEPSSAFRARWESGYKEGTFLEGKFEDVTLTNSYDMALFIHSIYTFKDGDYAKKVHEHLAPEGSIVIVSNGPNSFLGGLKKIVDENAGSRRELGTVLRDFERERFSFESQQYTSQSEPVLANGELTAAGRILFEWITLGRQLESDVEKRALDYIRGNTVDNRVEDQELVVRAVPP